jgi:hypothetical protein
MKKKKKSDGEMMIMVEIVRWYCKWIIICKIFYGIS